jgi:hypothetical protein
MNGFKCKIPQNMLDLNTSITNELEIKLKQNSD